MTKVLEFLYNYSPKELLKIHNIQSDANYYELPSASSSKIGGVSAGSNITIDGDKLYLSIDNFKNLCNSLKNNINTDTIENSYFCYDSSIAIPKKTEQRGVNRSISTWTLTDLLVSVPLFLVIDSPSVTNASCLFYVESGAYGGTTKNTKWYGSTVGGRPTEIFITVPNSTTVVIKTSCLGDDEAMYAFQ